MRKTAVAALLFSLAPLAFAEAPGQPVPCQSCDGWNRPQAPFKVYGNTWYVGTAGLSALLVTSPQGHVLLDGALPQSAARIEKNIEALGFRVKDVKLILNSHAHWDHAGGIPVLQRDSGALVAASASSARALQTGTNVEDDPQFDPVHPVHIARLAKVKVVADGEAVTVGPLKLTAHLTPGHTPGSTAWTWRSCENGKCLDIVYADSLTPVSSDAFRFSGDATHPDISASFQASIDKVAALPCDVVVSTHPEFTDTFKKLAATTPTHNAFVGSGQCRAYAAAASRTLAERLARERGANSAQAPALHGDQH
jgi:metallo-beta-lactamase class B